MAKLDWYQRVSGLLVVVGIIGGSIWQSHRQTQASRVYEANEAAYDLSAQADSLIWDIKLEIDSTVSDLVWPRDHTRDELAAYCRIIHTPGSLGGSYSIYDGINSSESMLQGYEDYIGAWRRGHLHLLAQEPAPEPTERSNLYDDWLNLQAKKTEIDQTLARIDQLNQICGLL